MYTLHISRQCRTVLQSGGMDFPAISTLVHSIFEDKNYMKLTSDHLFHVQVMSR